MHANTIKKIGFSFPQNVLRGVTTLPRPVWGEKTISTGNRETLEFAGEYDSCREKRDVHTSQISGRT